MQMIELKLATHVPWPQETVPSASVSLTSPIHGFGYKTYLVSAGLPGLSCPFAAGAELGFLAGAYGKCWTGTAPVHSCVTSAIRRGRGKGLAPVCWSSLPAVSGNCSWGS